MPRETAPSAAGGIPQSQANGISYHNQMSEDPNRMMLKDMGVDSNTMAIKLGKEREDERILA